MDEDIYAEIREENIFFPFASKSEWELGNFLSSGSLSQKDVDRYLQLERNKMNPVSFNTAKDLRARIEALPEVPRWRHQEITVAPYKTKSPLMLYWRDGLEIVEHLFRNPVFAQCMDFTPYRDFEIPQDHSFVGVIAASDKTPLTIGTGNKEMHPLLISIANIHASVRMKATSHSFALAAYLPIPKFLNVSKPVQTVLSARVYHFAVSIVMKNLKIASAEGRIMSDPTGNLRMVHTPLVSWIADYPEQLLIACVTSKNSPISIATARQFGDAFAHTPRRRQHTLDIIETACSDCDPCDIPAFHKTCQGLRLNGVVAPFWADWSDACPSLFLTPDALHQWHKFYFDHPLQWTINIIGGKELDRRLSSIQPRTGTRHWANGVSTLKQCTGREHRDLEKLLPVVAAGAVKDDVLRALRAITEFIFLAQSLFHYEETLHSLSEALTEFHHYKASILVANGRRGKNGPLDHFEIPKLELAQHVARSIRAMGAPYQWSSDITERCHITHVKAPYRMSNHRDFHTQCCRFLDRQEKQRFFQLFTALKSEEVPLMNEMFREADSMALHFPEATWVSHLLPGEYSVGTMKPVMSLFDKAHSHVSRDNSTAILLTKRPHNVLPIDEAAQTIAIQDLRPALGDFFSGRTYESRRGRRVSSSNCSLTFSSINLWHRFRMQQRSVQNPDIMSPAQTIQAAPPSSKMPYGRGNTVLITHTSGAFMSPNVPERYLVVQVRAVLQPVGVVPDQPLLYVEFFNFSPHHIAIIDGTEIVVPAPNIDMFLVQRRHRSNSTRLGDIVPLEDVRQVIQLVPKFGKEISPTLDSENSLEVAREFYINNFADKETFHAILSYQ
ncbi:hypothetical protein BJ138DRAFT_1087120 [Hygrophoropsis aurantiaca]|uniref:Uncharacterized protein n=1 Tax=Hygrophoropsis aurantiaca TaxID=72124 RepID=A0ACB8ACE7_9AGAM|nr:hypothetical protein BJ138DRAFT_1087120 [Hygrophoropsis aurantiaca]